MTFHRSTFLAFVGLFVGISSGFAQLDQPQDKLKALFLYKFTEYVTWPEESETARIGVLNAPEVLKQLRNLQVTRSNLEVVDVRNFDDAESLHVLFLSKASEEQHKDYIKVLNSKSTLIVCEDMDLKRLGVGIAFFQKDGRIGYFVNEGSLQRRNLVPSGKLLGMGGTR